MDPLQYKDLYNLQSGFSMKQYQLAEPYLNILTQTEYSLEMERQTRELQAQKAEVEALQAKMENELRQWETLKRRAKQKLNNKKG